MREKVILILKFLLFVICIPIVISATIGFKEQIFSLPRHETEAFLAGILIYLLGHLFVGEPEGFYQYGQKMVSELFKFLTPLVETIPFYVPIYSFIILVIFSLFKLLLQISRYDTIFMFLIGFTLTMHFVLTAKALRERDANVMHPSYYFSMSLIYIINISVLALLFGFILSDFSFSQFFNTATQISVDIYKAVFTHLFVV